MWQAGQLHYQVPPCARIFSYFGCGTTVTCYLRGCRLDSLFKFILSGVVRDWEIGIGITLCHHYRNHYHPIPSSASPSSNNLKTTSRGTKRPIPKMNAYSTNNNGKSSNEWNNYNNRQVMLARVEIVSYCNEDRLIVWEIEQGTFL